MNIYIARHGESRGNIGEDSVDPVLTERGVEQANQLAEQLEKIKLDAVISSPLIRAVQTAKPIARLQGLSVELLPELMEVDSYLFEHEEKPADSMKRARKVIQHLKDRFSDDEKILVVAHGTFNNYLILAACGFDFLDGFNFSQDNACLTLIRYINDNGQPRTKLAFANKSIRGGFLIDMK